MTPYNTPRPSLFQRLLPDGRLHLQEGPIDLVIEGFGADKAVRRAYAAAVCLADVLPGLVAELPALKHPLAAESPGVQDPVAGRTVAACRPHPYQLGALMAAVEGAVADHLRPAMAEAARAGQRAGR